MPTRRLRVVTDDGVGLEARVTGEGPGLLLVHGFVGAKEDFADHEDALAATGHRVVTFDHRGHGQSDHPDDVAAYSLDRLAADAFAVADAADLGSFRLLGHSMGGMASRRMVLARPERISALILMDTSPGPVPGMDPELLELAATIVLEEGKDVLKPLLDEAAALETPPFRRLLVTRPGYQEFQDAKWAAAGGAMWAAMAREMARQPEQLADLAQVRCPTLVIVGAEDAPFRPGADAMAATIPGARLVVVPDAGHAPQFENPSVWFDAIAGFLTGLDALAPAADA